MSMNPFMIQRSLAQRTLFMACLTFLTIEPNTFEIRTAKIPTFNTFDRQSYRLDMEYDITSNQAVYLKGGYTRVNERLNGRSRCMEDPEVSWQCLFYGDRCSAFSGRLTAIIPAGDKKCCVRYGKFGVEFKFLYSRIFELFDRQWWVDLNLGYRTFTGFLQINCAAIFQLATQ